MVSKYSLIFSFIAFSFVACGGAKTNTHIVDGSAPVLIKTNPSSVSRGATLELTGTGFSIVAAENIVSIGGISVPATTYATTNGEEKIILTVPAAATIGSSTLFVVIDGSVSNPMTMTITP